MTIEGPGLAEGIRTGNPDAQRKVVEAYLPQILRASRAAGLDGATAEDIVQPSAAWSACWGKLVEFGRLGGVVDIDIASATALG
jgi:hypothetical protein